MPIFMGKEVNISEIDIIDRLSDDAMYIDAINDAISEIQKLRWRVAELESRPTPLALDLATRTCEDVGNGLMKQSPSCVIHGSPSQ